LCDFFHADQPATDLILTATLTIARALSTRTANQHEQQKADLEAIEKAIHAIEKQVGGLDEITRLGTTIKGNSEKILDRARIMNDALTREIRSLDEHMEDIKLLVSETE
jgi:predicted  nucleic acid-binding Zn-ribbon protein